MRENFYKNYFASKILSPCIACNPIIVIEQIWQVRLFLISKKYRPPFVNQTITLKLYLFSHWTFAWSNKPTYSSHFLTQNCKQYRIQCVRPNIVYHFMVYDNTTFSCRDNFLDANALGVSKYMWISYRFVQIILFLWRLLDV